MKGHKMTVEPIEDGFRVLADGLPIMDLTLSQGYEIAAEIAISARLGHGVKSANGNPACSCCKEKKK